jgi:pimeloyl-ACP methyl ester carboxylesterase
VLHCQKKDVYLSPIPLLFTGCNGISLVADHYGSATGTPVLLLHGGGQTRHSWLGTAQRLAQAGYRVISVDARGHGDSAWADDGDYSADTMVGDLRCIIEQLDAAPILVGASMGGLTSMVAVGEGHTPSALALVLVDIAPRTEVSGVARIITFMSANPQGFATLEEVRDAIAAYNPNRPPPKDTSGLKKNLRLGDDGRYRWHWDPRFLDYAPTKNQGETLTSIERRLAAAAKVQIPTLLVRGANSDVVSHEGAQELKALIPHAQIVDISGAGHMIAGDRNDVFAETILSFIRDNL